MGCRTCRAASRSTRARGRGLSPAIMGEMAGSETVTLSSSNLPSHTHYLYSVNNAQGNTTSPASALPAASSAGDNLYYIPPSNPTQPVGMEAGIVSIAGQSLPHDNVQPILAINFIISLYGVYPQQG